MGRFIVAVALVITAVPLIFGQAPAKPAQSEANRMFLSDTEQTVTRHVNEFFASMRKGDLAAIEMSLADDYTLIGVNGAFRTKAQRLEWLKGNVKYLATITPSELKVRAYGDAVVVTGLVTIEGEGEEPTVNERFMQVWVKRGGAWRMVAGQVTAVAPVQSTSPTSEKKP